MKALNESLLREQLQASRLGQEVSKLEEPLQMLYYAVREYRLKIKLTKQEQYETEESAMKKEKAALELEMKRQISMDVVEGKYKPYRNMTEAQVQVAAELDTNDKWDLLGNTGLAFKARQLEYLGWNLSPHCKKKLWRKCRKHDDDFTESMEDFKAYLQEVVGFVPTVQAAEPSVQPATVSEESVSAEMALKILEAYKKNGKRGLEELLQGMQEGGDLKPAATEQAPSKKPRLG